MKLRFSHTEKELKELQNNEDFVHTGYDHNGVAIFHSTKIIDVLSPREYQVFELQDKKDSEIAKLLDISAQSVLAYRKKIEDKGFYFDADAVINWSEISRILSGNRSVITKNRMPKRHEENVNKLRQLIRMWGISLRS